MRTLLTIAALFILSTVSLGQGPIPQSPGFWEGTWDTFSDSTDDRHQIDISINGTPNPTGTTYYDVFVSNESDGSNGSYDAYMVSTNGALYVGWWLEDDAGEVYFETRYVLWAVNDVEVKYWGHMPNEGGIATKRDG